MQPNIYLAQQSRDYYGIKLLFAFLLLIGILSYVSFYLFENYFSNSFLGSTNAKTIYFLKSDTLQNMYAKNNMDYEDYTKRVSYLKNILKKHNYNTKNIYAEKLKTIQKNSSLIAMDMMSLSPKEIAQIDSFVQNGGRILFNFTSGFLDRSLKYNSDNLVYKISGLKLDKDINTIKLDPKSSIYISTKILSPLTYPLKDSYAMDINVYDPLPVFEPCKSAYPDAYLTNWPQTNYIKISKTKELDYAESSVLWHGTKGIGKWVYFSFPSYVFMDIKPKKYEKLFVSMVEYLQNMISVIPYPYVDAKNVVFVSEDTEYKFENLKNFYEISLKHKFPVTAFCVANLAQKNAKIMQEVSKSPYMEIGSHSYTHKQIVGMGDDVYKRESIGSKQLLDTITNQNIIGFRAPREEIDEKLLKYLKEGGFKYILNEGENRLSGYFKDGILIIPRHATDDYSYLINLDWSADEILKNMIKELNVVVRLDGMYTLSTHTHLMTFGENIKIVDRFFEYVKGCKDMYPMNGRMIYKRLRQIKNVKLSLQKSSKKVMLQIENFNDDEVEDIHFEIDIDPDKKIKNVESEIVGVKTDIKQLSDTRYLLVVKSLKPDSKIVVFLNYAKNY